MTMRNESHREFENIPFDVIRKSHMDNDIRVSKRATKFHPIFQKFIPNVYFKFYIIMIVFKVQNIRVCARRGAKHILKKGRNFENLNFLWGNYPFWLERPYFHHFRRLCSPLTKFQVKNYAGTTEFSSFSSMIRILASKTIERAGFFVRWKL